MLQRLQAAAAASRRAGAEEARTPRQIRRRLGGDAVKEIIAQYLAGATAKTLADTHGVSKTALLALFREDGVALRRRPLTDEQLRDVIARYKAGDSIYTIERDTGIPKSSVQRALNRSGLAMRAR